MRVLVTGAGGFIGDHLVRALKARGDWVRGADLHAPLFRPSVADEFQVCDLRRSQWARAATDRVDVVFALAADMGGMGYIPFHDAGILTSNLAIDLNTAEMAWRNGVERLVFASSACVYPLGRQAETEAVPLAEADAYPANPQDGYGWEKLITERLLGAYQAEGRVHTRVARLHAIYGPFGAWDGERAKAPAALCRKAAMAADGGQIEVWGDGRQTRSFCHVSDAVDGLLRLADSDWCEPVNIGTERLVTVDGLADLIIAASGKQLGKVHVAGPQGVRGRNADLTLCRKVLDWEPQVGLEQGLADTYQWVDSQVRSAHG